MPQIDIYDIKGTKKGKISLPPALFAAKVNSRLMAQAVRVYLARGRKARAKTKTRGEVSRTKAKVWRQKGTGRARHGARSAPIFVGGGVAHGPRGNQNYVLKLSKKMRHLALASALTSKLKEGQILVIDGLEKIEPKTREMMAVLKVFELDRKGLKKLVVTGKGNKNLSLAARNIKEVSLAPFSSLNTYQVLAAGKVIFLKKSFAKNEKNGQK